MFSVSEVELGSQVRGEPVRAGARLGDERAGVEAGGCGHLVEAGCRRTHSQDTAHAVAGHPDRAGASLGLRGEEIQTGTGIADHALHGKGVVLRNDLTFDLHEVECVAVVLPHNRERPGGYRIYEIEDPRRKTAGRRRPRERLWCGPFALT
ncbi:hypothetical protein GCM10012275_10390 [Longimycelium tulufanense]|uniref:Uncharacterized protein n=1 Tax=Longimycelium tulufanense TaxID=907463 RepID=A0A8J3C6P2_9PSEU|nr:hypothetical protein GCM10012275_10390 [Longimycelium tulufanense]